MARSRRATRSRSRGSTATSAPKPPAATRSRSWRSSTASRDNPETSASRSCRTPTASRSAPSIRAATASGRTTALPGNEGRMNVQNNDVTVRFTVRVPAGVALDRQDGQRRRRGHASERRRHPDDRQRLGQLLHVRRRPRVHRERIDSRRARTRRLVRHAARCQTVNGSITLTLPPDLNTDVKATTVNGDISTDFPDDGQRDASPGGKSKARSAAAAERCRSTP